VLIGYDGRAGARELAHLAADLLTTHGLSRVLRTGAAPTPALGRLVWQHSHLNAAIIVTASHNPPGFLGVKLRDGQGQGIPWPAPSDDQRAPIATLPAAPQPHPSLDVLPAYATTIGQTLTATAHRFDGHLIIDAAHGALGALATHLPELAWHRPRPLPFFAGRTPDPALRPQADDLATTLLATAADPGRTLIAMVDGDGDRLALYTTRSGYISSAEQAAVLLATGLGAERLITTAVSPRAAVHTARQRGVQVELVPVGFTHIVTAWRQNTQLPTLGVEPNGALAWSEDEQNYFERDSLAALSTVLTHLPSLTTLDDAIADLRRQHPYPQRIITVTNTLDETLNHLRTALSTWDMNTTHDPVTLFDGGPHGQITVRASGTEPGTRLYLEASPTTTDRITERLSTSA
jgi:phosphomannomutase